MQKEARETSGQEETMQETQPFRTQGKLIDK